MSVCINPATEQMFGYAAGEFVGRLGDCSELHHLGCCWNSAVEAMAEAVVHVEPAVPFTRVL